MNLRVGAAGPRGANIPFLYDDEKRLDKHKKLHGGKRSKSNLPAAVSTDGLPSVN